MHSELHDFLFNLVPILLSLSNLMSGKDESQVNSKILAIQNECNNWKPLNIFGTNEVSCKNVTRFIAYIFNS